MLNALYNLCWDFFHLKDKFVFKFNIFYDLEVMFSKIKVKNGLFIDKNKMNIENFQQKTGPHIQNKWSKLGSVTGNVWKRDKRFVSLLPSPFESPTKTVWNIHILYIETHR